MYVSNIFALGFVAWETNTGINEEQEKERLRVLIGLSALPT